MIDPFQNNSQSMQIGNLIIENQIDKVTIYGDIDIYQTQQSFEQVQQLHELTKRLLLKLQTPNKQHQHTNNNNINKHITETDNPFL